MEKQLEEIRSDVKDIKSLLAGDDFGRKGLVESHTEVKYQVHKNKENINRVKWVGAVATALLLILNAVKEWFKT